MMKKRVLIIFGLSLIILFLGSCQPASSNQELSRAELREKLESAEEIPRSAAFQRREFLPYQNDQWIGKAISYGCYRAGQAPGKSGPSSAEILEDLQIIQQHWNLIRVYNADADTERILEVIKANNLPLKMMLGIWLENETDQPQKQKSNIANTLKALELAAQYPQTIIALNVGNETQVYWSWHKMQRQDLIRYLRIVRKNSNVPITTADDYNFWNKAESREVAAELDFIVAHIYPLWNGKTLENAMPWFDTTYRELRKFHPEQEIVIGEVGWATNYNPEKKGPDAQGTLIKGEVSLDAQYRFLVQLERWIEKNRTTTFLFEAFDELWKGGEQTGLNEIEKNWGVFYTNRKPKESFQRFLSDKKQAPTKMEDQR
ncbi:MAG: hypothetical protein R6U84_08225 [Candidatus Cloacimonadales bacterium]